MDADERNTGDAAAVAAAASLAHPYVWTSCVFLAESPHRRSPLASNLHNLPPSFGQATKPSAYQVAPPMLLPHLGGLFPVWNDSNRREPNEPVHSLTMPRLGVIAPGPGLTTLDAQRPSTRLRPTVHRQLPARTNAPVFPFAP